MGLFNGTFPEDGRDRALCDCYDKVWSSKVVSLATWKTRDYGNPDAFYDRKAALGELIELCRDAQCTDIRDKIFGLLGLHSPEE